MNADVLYKWIAQGEHQQQDFKYEISDISKIAHSVSAFANTEGGRLLVGVKDNGKIAGVRTDEEYYMIEAAASSYCMPEVKVDVQVVVAEGKHVLVADIHPSSERPVYAREADGSRVAYVRVADENIVANAVHLQLWRDEHKQKGACLTFTEREQNLLQMLDVEEGITLNQFCRCSLLSRRKAVWLLAHFVRYGVVEMVFVNHVFRFRQTR